MYYRSVGAMKYMVLLLIILLRLVCCQNIISTIAGTGSRSYSGDNGAATSAALDYPTGVAVDGSGRILSLLSAALVHSYKCSQ